MGGAKFSSEKGQVKENQLRWALRTGQMITMVLEHGWGASSRMLIIIILRWVCLGLCLVG